MAVGKSTNRKSKGETVMQCISLGGSYLFIYTSLCVNGIWKGYVSKNLLDRLNSELYPTHKAVLCMDSNGNHYVDCVKI